MNLFGTLHRLTQIAFWKGFATWQSCQLCRRGPMPPGLPATPFVALFRGPNVVSLHSNLHLVYYDKFNICNWICVLNLIFHKWTLTSFYCPNISLWKFLLTLWMFNLWEFSTQRSFTFPIVNYICIHHYNSLYCCEGYNGLSQSQFDDKSFPPFFSS